MSSRNWFRSWLSNHHRNPARWPRTRLAAELLEARDVPSALSIGDATAVEGVGNLKFLDRFVAQSDGGITYVDQMILGPDGNGDGVQDLYVADQKTSRIVRFDGVTGSYIDTFVPSGSGGLNWPLDLAFGPDGDLYVSSWLGNQILRYDGSTGAFLGAVVSNLNLPVGITFGPDGSLFIANRNANEVLRYANGSLSTFIPAGSGGLSLPRRAVFGPDGNGDGAPDLYVASEGSGNVLRYDGLTGAFIDTFATPGSAQGPMWLAFGTDGYLYVTARMTSGSLNMSFLRFNAASGAFADCLALGRDGWSFYIGPGNVIYSGTNSAGPFVDRFGPSSLAAFTVTLDAPSASPVTVDYATASGTATAGSDFTPVSGTLTFAPSQTSQTILVPTLNDSLVEGTETFTVTLSNPVGATVTRGLATGTITDDDTTKFYSVDDGGTDRTYRYGVPGNALATSTLGSGDTAPRGVATTAAGTKVWVVDANKNVYVYSPAGALLGSWSAGGLSGAAQLTGIATNGTDIWLLDNKTDKVFKYMGAASRTAGSQSAASSFALNRYDTNPTDVVTDGTSIWVVDDGSSADKVYKYALSGTLLGSWTIDPADSHPTGITVNPANVSDIWIVDNGTDKVYQYAGAASRTSGSQSAAATFALNPYDTNPQGIADPPAGAGTPTRHHRHAHHATHADRWLSPEEFGWEPIDVSAHAKPKHA